ncbi:MAG: alpha/beta hydrolase [Anaerolineae bacterium]
MALATLNFESQYLNGNTTVSVILPDKSRDVAPDAFYGSGIKYPVLWLLHGTFGDHSDWVRKSMIELYAREQDLVVVMPSALNSDYSNWDGCMMGYSMFDYLTKELMPLIYNWFPVSDRREDNFIAGLSMGGGGTLKYALAHPDRFAAAAVLSSSARNYERLLDSPEAAQDKRLANRLRNYGGNERFLDSNENTWRMLGEMVNRVDLPRIYCACGTKDFGYDRFLEFKAYAQGLGADITFEEIEGYAHEWRFWDLTIQKTLKFFGLDKRASDNLF